MYRSALAIRILLAPRTIVQFDALEDLDSLDQRQTAFHWRDSQNYRLGAVADVSQWGIIILHFIAAAADGISLEP